MDQPALARGALTEAKGIAAGMPDLLVEARRVAATVLAGWHGRRASGRGETFWQFRPFVTGVRSAGARVRMRQRTSGDSHVSERHVGARAVHGEARHGLSGRLALADTAGTVARWS